MWTTGKIKAICDWIQDHPPEPTAGESLIAVGKTLVAAVPLVALSVGTIFEATGRAVLGFFGL